MKNEEWKLYTKDLKATKRVLETFMTITEKDGIASLIYSIVLEKVEELLKMPTQEDKQ